MHGRKDVQDNDPQLSDRS